MTSQKLIVQPDGRLIGPARIEYNRPFPTANGTPGGGANQMMGVVMHTMVANLPQCISWFNDPNSEASAFFGVAQDGLIIQFGPVGHNWMAWAQVDGNPEWYSIEHADNGNPDNPLTAAQIHASAQLVECLSAFARFPLVVSDSTGIRGYGVHYMGGQAWGGHTCPDLPPEHVRSRQRHDILWQSLAIRGAPKTRTGSYIADGRDSMRQAAQANAVKLENVIWATAEHAPGGFGKEQAAYFNAGDMSQPMPAGMVYWIP